MSKEEGGRLLSKVAKFVRNPLKDWSELDSADRSQQPSPVDSDGYSREALKELIERRQRNDFVRRREFDMLRKLRQREAAGIREGAVASSSFHMNTVGKTDGRALTLKKIDEIEEQMSQQWWKGRQSGPGAPEPAPQQTPQHARAYADTAPGEVPPESAPANAPELSLPFRTPVEEASIRFAMGDEAGAERLLLQAVAPDGAFAADDDAWRALLDLYRATGDGEKFAAASMRYAQRLRRPGPEWLSLRAVAREQQPVENEVSVDWYCPSQLGREGLLELTRALSRAGPVWSLDWRALRGIDADAVAPLGTLFSHWADTPTQLRFVGAERLVEVLAAATPLAVRDTEQAWWLVHLGLMRLMHAPDDFELVALNYCITYEIVPPSWKDPVGSFSKVELSAGGSRTGLQLSQATAAEPQRAQLAGEIRGAAAPVWQRLQVDLVDATEPIVECGGLVRLDLAAAQGLMAWARAHEAKGARVQLRDVHRLLIVFLTLVGVAAHADLHARP